jgi:hypothetical protein
VVIHYNVTSLLCVVLMLISYRTVDWYLCGMNFMGRLSQSMPPRLFGEFFGGVTFQFFMVITSLVLLCVSRKNQRRKFATMMMMIVHGGGVHIHHCVVLFRLHFRSGHSAVWEALLSVLGGILSNRPGNYKSGKRRYIILLLSWREAPKSVRQITRN